MSNIHTIEVRQLGQRVIDSSGPLDILDGVSFTVDAGQAVAITGSSGSGKSTLLGLLAGLDVPSSGQVILLGHDLFTLNEEARTAVRAEHIGFVFQSFQLLPNLTALENVMLPLELANKPAKQAARAMLERVGLAERLDHYPRTLSGGEQQRVSLARAFVVQPKVLFADEPTGSLDSQNGALVMDLMFSLVAEQHTTLVLVTHDPGLAQRCQKEIRLSAGKMLA
ncbi:ABC transporter ATP-binding protein [Alcaligenaceae bacterium]|nr:ABC transporter ATP-binding protein [Alcaligenaceae bacterium]